VNPLSITIAAVFESGACWLADIFQLFLDLRKGFTAEPDILELVMDSWAFLPTESMGFAYFPDLKSMGAEGLKVDYSYDNSVLLEGFIIKEKISVDAEAIRRKVDLFLAYVQNAPEKAKAIIEKHSSLHWCRIFGKSKIP
jgi:hypothetical protein